MDTQLILRARSANLIDYLNQNGYKLIKSGRNEYRLWEHDSLVISNNKWHWFSRNIGGNTLDFLIKYEEKDFLEAVNLLNSVSICNTDNANTVKYHPFKAEAKNDELILPEKNLSYNRVFTYLHKTRKIDKKIILELIAEQKIYESVRHNCVFVGKDSNGVIRFACERGTLSNRPFKTDCHGSDKRYCFSMEGISSQLFVFEAPIDALSHATLFKLNNLDYKMDHRISLCSLSEIALIQYLKDKPQIKSIVLCLDNDKYGIEAAKKIQSLLLMGEYAVSVSLPERKDYNEHLIEFIKL